MNRLSSPSPATASKPPIRSSAQCPSPRSLRRRSKNSTPSGRTDHGYRSHSHASAQADQEPGRGLRARQDHRRSARRSREELPRHQGAHLRGLRPGAALRQHLRQRRGHPFSAEPRDAGEGERRNLHRAGHCRRKVIVKKRVYLTFPTELIKQPVVCDMYDRYKVRFSIRTASVSEEIGIIGLELEGEDERVQAAMAFFRERGIRVEPIELDVVEG